MIVRSRSPVRISFGGGGTDVPPYSDEFGGCVVAASISKYSYATLETRSDNEIHIESADLLQSAKFSSVDEMKYDNKLDLLKAVVKRMNVTGMGVNVFMRSDIPFASGLGGSGAAFAAMIGVFNHLKQEKKMTNYEVAELAYKIEREELKVGGGRQDQYSSVFGGINYIEFGNGWVRVNPLRIKKDHVMELEKNLVLAYVGPRTGEIISDQTKRAILDHSALDKTKQIAQDIRYALLRGDLNGFGNLLDIAWNAKKQQSTLITNRRIDDIYDFAKKHGALGGKITGAGGGGFMMFYCNGNKEHIVAEKLREIGLQPLTFTFDHDGLQTWDVVL